LHVALHHSAIGVLVHVGREVHILHSHFGDFNVAANC
jgi:hypothetical protein